MAIAFPVYPVTVGPIVGATTDTSVRLWGRGGPSRPPGGRYCYLVAQVLMPGSTLPSQGAYVLLRAEDDFTGSVDLTGLLPGQVHAYRVGYFFSDVEQHLLAPAVGLDLQGASAGAFRTARQPGSPELSFVFGSCRSPGPSEDEVVGLGNRGDVVFGTVYDQLAGMPTDLLLMVGDQIYADVRRDARTFEEYCAAYREAFTQPNLRKLMARVPTYMVLDDHEIADNWSMDKLVDPKLSDEKRWDNRVRFLAAMEAYRAYQVVHGPALERRDVPGLTNTLTRYWYDFQVGPARFFVLDTRTERYHLARPPQIIGPPQMEALKQWLMQDAGGLKFVVSSVPLFPDVRLAGLMEAERKDKWAGFLLQRQHLLDFIRDNDVRRVVFLSGDIHASLWSELRSTSRPDFRLYSVISSAFAAPAFVAPEFMYEQAGILDGQSDYVVTRHGGYVQVSNFTRLTWREPVLRVEVFERKGARIQDAELRLDA
ncbi:alkaline phosphatase family protein [Pyxidicoccus parkwayensis]|uniref:Alkaline phosphatase family protein n=1 Tax=Pyxidicoccus parkwayensis TaxID=2813578 RepID=A0ABX7NRC5_9BACT|nr:alkaline phosphatase D family protein [Pyxidicoccus parkwaysis]QSQ21422.1 alkaline phosphatase family protein [Pyxidicoccus parkwaysis]